MISLTMLLQSKRLLQKNVFISLVIYNVFPFAGVILSLFKYGISWINLGYGLGALHLFYSSIKLMELEFFSDKHDGTRLNPNYKQGTIVPEMKKRIARSHLWQIIAAISGGLLLVLVIISIQESVFRNGRLL